MLIVLALLLQTAAPEAEADRLFRLGTELVAEGDTAGAVAAWEGIAATGRTSAAVEHNLGTLALARGDAGRARLHLERAARLAPFDDAIARNVGLAREAVGAEPPSAAGAVWQRVAAVAGPLGLVALALALVFGAVGLYLLGRPRGALAVAGVAVVAVGAASAALWERSRPDGVVLAREAEVFGAPSASAARVAGVRAGDVVLVGEAASGWRRVWVDGAAGWLPERAVARL